MRGLTGIHLNSAARRAVVGLALALALVGLTAPAPALGDPYAADPLRLVPFADTVQQVYTDGTDEWEVWLCRVPNWNVPLDTTEVVDDLNTRMTPYFRWLSRDRYHPSFTVGGEVFSDDVVPTLPNGEAFQVPGCEAEVAAATAAQASGVLIVVAARFSDGYATGGAVCPEPPFTGCTTTYPSNFRVAVVGADAVDAASSVGSPLWSTVAHELGHGLNWAHSYGGLTTIPATGLVNTYDNPMDLMSGGARSGIPVGTIAYHRYTAGWIEPGEVDFHTSAEGVYRLAAIGASGTQMLVIPLEEEGHFYTLDARRRTSYDASLPQAGVEAYEIDQRPRACEKPDAWPSEWPCFATLTRVAQTPAVAGTGGTAHVLGIDEDLEIGPFLVRVEAADTESFTVRVTDTRLGLRFVDDDFNLHEKNIEAIAALDITKGCNPPLNDRYCPDGTVTRAEMAAFLIRAIDQESNLSPFVGIFPDVPDGSWFAPYVERLFQLGITEGFTDGTYRPDSPVNRAEMAIFLVRAFAHEDLLGTPSNVFADVNPAAPYAPYADVIYEVGITRGCLADPLAFCPLDLVQRDQMASFLARALGIEA
jgi:hypothetical protein